MALRTGLKGTMRLNLMESPEKCLLYAGELFKAFLMRADIAVEGQVFKNTSDSGKYRLFYQHLSSLDLSQLLEKMFKSSNNFMANQIFLAMGAWKYGPPAGILKSRRIVNEYLSQMGLSGIQVEEGSGLSPLNRITAAQMIKILEEFNSHRSLLVDRDGVLLKTGSLKEVKSMAGYLLQNPSQSLPFVIILNGRQYDYQIREHILSLLKKNLLE
jgi:D-alanyl-D-alanine carboxypeptidase/D-alanyl-D-alanine-endopeptidase (penicillin-binding protein 4)